MVATIPISNFPASEALQRRGRRQSDDENLRESFSKQRLCWSRIDWVVTGFLVVVHLGCLAAPFFFSWPGLLVFLALHWLTCSVGVCLGYHRYLSHRSMKLRTPAKFSVLLAGSLSGEGSPLTWAATHRLHHQKSDQDGDPHSPLHGSLWSHILWLFVYRKAEEQQTLFRRYAPELMHDSMLRFFERTFAFWLWGQGLVLLGSGWVIGGWQLGVSLLVWGMCVRMVVAYHSTWFVNSATHLWGYRNYDTRDESRNLWWVALLAYGEGWHNNHHAHPSVAPAGHRWWEIDMTWWVIRGMQVVGLAYDVRDRIPEGCVDSDVFPQQDPTHFGECVGR